MEYFILECVPGKRKSDLSNFELCTGLIQEFANWINVPLTVLIIGYETKKVLE